MVNKRPVGAHRISYQLAHPGEDIDGLLIRHKCDNPPCVNPAHLEPGTYQDNADDRVARERQLRGESTWNSRLTEAQVLAIRADPRPQAQVAAEYGITKSNVSDIQRRKTWKHL
jgi:hypothetical protein